jgi:hypothetical protein
MPQLSRDLAFLLLVAATAAGQTTQGLISGSVVSIQDGRSVALASITYTDLKSGASGVRSVSPDGAFALPLLPPGVYRLRVAAPEFQAQEMYQLELPVAGTLDLVFRLRPLRDVWESRERHNVFLPGNSVLVFFGPDVDLSRTTSVQPEPARNGILESTMSQVIDPVLIRELPLAGRDVYAALATQPGVASDAPTGRGLGLSVNGQRPSSTNFMLDGVENNNYLLSGPLTRVAPEAVQEYRVSTNNFSAEYGRTAGVVANAVTRSGGAAWHGIAYLFLKNEWLNANDFQRNARTRPRLPLKELEPGFYLGGPLRNKVLFASASFDRSRFRSHQDDQPIIVPSLQFLSQLRPGSVAANLFQRYAPPPAVGTGPCVLTGFGQDAGCSAAIPVGPPSSIDQTLASGRLDRDFKDGANRLFLRGITSRVSRPDFSWSPYPAFTAPLHQNDTGIALGWIGAVRPNLTIEARAGWSADEIRFDRANNDQPGLAGPSGMLLPGSLLFYAYRNHSRNVESMGNLLWTKSRHIVKAGAGYLDRRIEGYQTAGREGYYAFPSARSIFLDQPFDVNIAVNREGSPSVVPDYDRAYRYRQWFGLFQGTWRASGRLTFNYGVRYENFGAPENVGAVKDTVVLLGPGGTLATSLAKSPGLSTLPSGNQKLYDSDNRNWAGRAGFAYSVDRSGRVVVRGAYGVFYDRPFDNLWQTLRHNAVQLGTVFFNFGQTFNYLASPRSTPAAMTNVSRDEIFTRVSLFQPGLRTPYVQSYFLGARWFWTRNLSFEAEAFGSLGRELMATDTINRLAQPGNVLPIVSYRSNQGNSNYSAGAAVLTWRSKRQVWQASYTWSHAMDNQSDPLLGEYGDLSFTAALTSRATSVASFSREYDSTADRGSSSFDQRQSAVVLGMLELPSPSSHAKAASLFRDWRISWLAAIRSGFPFTVGLPFDATAPIVNNRADVTQPGAVYSGVTPVNGGRIYFNPGAFAAPPGSRLGTSGRNALAGPGFWNVDLSLARSITARRLGEAGRVTLRAAAINVANHANLGAPNSLMGSEGFAVALYGRSGYDSGAPSVTPFHESARQVQLGLRVEF